MNNFFQNKKYIIIFIGFFIVIIIGYYFFHNTKEVAEEKKSDFSTRNLSRVSFFHTQPFRCTMAIPADWEGEYRMREKGNSVSFSYIINPEQSPIIFSVLFFSREEWEKNKKGKEILILNDTIFTYELSTDKKIKDAEKEKFDKMKEDTTEIVKTLKCVNK